MSGLEIERKFLVKKNFDYKALAHKRYAIKQGYMMCYGATVRVRLRDEEAFLTIKEPSNDGGLSRYEFEKQITVDEAMHLLRLCAAGRVEKNRYLIDYEGHCFEVDEFLADNAGLILAEVEMQQQDELVKLPPFIDKEVTGDKRYYNSYLVAHPYSQWKGTEEVLQSP